MPSVSNPPLSNPPLPRFVYLYSMGQVIVLMVAMLAVTMTVPVATTLAPNPWVIGVPYGVQFLAILMATYPLSSLMEKQGRAIGFNISAIAIIGAGVLAYMALTYQNFWLLVCVHFCIGVFVAGGHFYRFAVTDTLPAVLHPKAVSYTVAGGIVAALFAPSIASGLKSISGYPDFLFVYLFLSVLGGVNLMLIRILPHAPVPKRGHTIDLALNSRVLQQTPYLKRYLWTLIFLAMLGQATMNQWMLQSIMYMRDIGFHFDHTASVIQWHVMGMFIPAFFTGTLIQKYGEVPIIISGMILLTISAGINIAFQLYFTFSIALILLGVGWNFAYVGAGATLAKLIKQYTLSKRWQGVTDTTIATFTVLFTNIPTILMLSIGWVYSNILTIALCTIGCIFMGKNAKLYYTARDNDSPYKTHME